MWAGDSGFESLEQFVCSWWSPEKTAKLKLSVRWWSRVSYTASGSHYLISCGFLATWQIRATWLQRESKVRMMKKILRLARSIGRTCSSVYTFNARLSSAQMKLVYFILFGTLPTNYSVAALLTLLITTYQYFLIIVLIICEVLTTKQCKQDNHLLLSVQFYIVCWILIV